jgi:hypothetical protein
MSSLPAFRARASRTSPAGSLLSYGAARSIRTCTLPPERRSTSAANRSPSASPASGICSVSVTARLTRAPDLSACVEPPQPAAASAQATDAQMLEVVMGEDRP